MSWEEVTIGGCRLICGDAYALIDDLQGDVLITDPVYGQSYTSDTHRRPPRNATGRRSLSPLYGQRRVHGNTVPFDPQPWLARFPRAIFWGANYFAEKLPPKASWLVWDKHASAAYDGKLSFADGELAWCSDGKPLRFHRQVWSGLIRQGRDAHTPRLHPMQKPVELLQWCIQRFPDVQSVVDPFAGSFTTAVACVTLGKTCVSVEIEPEYWEQGCRRVEAAYRQLDMYQPQTWEPPQQLTLT